MQLFQLLAIIQLVLLRQVRDLVVLEQQVLGFEQEVPELGVVIVLRLLLLPIEQVIARPLVLLELALEMEEYQQVELAQPGLHALLFVF